jgi:D-glycero-D-manno-heptose 1,7-bisphosphate phosphatase
MNGRSVVVPQGGRSLRWHEMTTPAIFLDRDGVINYNRADYVKTWHEFEFLPGALGALRQLAGLGWPVIVVSNQSAIGRGLISQATVADINRRMIEVVQAAGGRIDEALFCPHHPAEACACRKPQPGLLKRAAERWQIALPASFLIGDAPSDMLAAQAAGCQPILVETGRGATYAAWAHEHAASIWRAADLGAAVQVIIERMDNRSFSG